jgi:predicted Zn finger-like uncharacterized protein
MLIVCPTCTTAYQIKLAALGEAGRTVRCASCKNTWFATPDSAIMEAETALVPVAAAAASRAAASAAPPPPPAKDDFADDDAAANFAVQTFSPADETSDAPVIDAPSIAPHDHEGETAKFEPGEPENIETIAARRARQKYSERKQKRGVLRRIASLPVLITVLLLTVLGALQWRVALVRQFPQTASLFAMIGMPVNLRGLTFMDVKSRGEFVDGAMVLVVEGTIVNLTPKALEVPRLRLALRSATGHEVYAWTSLPTQTMLGSGDGLPFRSRLASPPPDGRDVIVRFFSRRDAGLGS